MPSAGRPVRPAARSRAATLPPLPAWAQICFLVSGAAGLLYEIAWSKQLSYVLGNSLHAVATVVAAFLGGLALGARVLGTPLARRGDGPRVYAALEIGIALLGLLSLPLLRNLDPVIGGLYRGMGGETALFAAARVAIVFVLLIPPAALMGATLPVLVNHFESSQVGPGLARLYAINTVGAVVGSAAAGFLLLPAVGLTGTTLAAALLNLLAALLAWRWAAPRPVRSAAASAPAAATPAPLPAGPPAGPRRPAGEELAGARWSAFALLFALSGFAALAFQIAWVRLFSLVFGSSVYSFSGVLGIYLLGLAAGSALAGRTLRGAVTPATFGGLLVTLALVAALQMHAFPRLPEWMFTLIRGAGTRWEALFAGEIALAAALLVVPCALLGAAFPIATRVLQRSDGGHATGLGYAVNTAGTIAGSLAAGFWAVPALGVRGTHLAATLLAGAAGLAALLLAGRPRRPLLPALGFGAAVAVALTAPRWDPALMSMGVFRPAQTANVALSASQEGGPGGPVTRASRAERVLYYREGLHGSVYVGTDPEGRDRWLRIGGKIDASTNDMDTQVLLGLIPGALARPGARALVVGQGSGVTTAAALAAGAGALEVAELEPAVIEASRFFHAPGEDPLDDPRVTVILGDARTRMAHGAGRYDLILSQPSNPWIAGINNLFTVDYYQEVRSRLAPDGVFCQWLQLYELSPATFATLAASMLEVFPEAHVFAVWKSVDLLIVAAPPSRTLDLDRLRTPAARRLLARAGLERAEDLAAFYAGPLASLEGAIRGVPLNRDDRPVVEYRAPRDLIAIGNSGRSVDQEVAAMLPFAVASPANRWFEGWTAPGWHEARVQALAAGGEIERAARAAAAGRAAGGAALGQRLDALVADGRRRAGANSLVERAMAQIRAGEAEAARATLAEAVAADPANARHWLLFGDRLRIAGDTAAAEAAFARGAASADPAVRADAANLRGLLEFGRQRPAAAVARFREAQAHAPAMSRSYLLEGRAWIAVGRPDSARAALERGLARNPDDPQLTAAVAELRLTP